MRIKAKTETRPYGANVCNGHNTKPLSGCVVARVLAVVEQLDADGYDGELAAVVARATGYSQATVQRVTSKAWLAERARCQTLESAMRGAVDEARRTYWSVVQEGAA